MAAPTITILDRLNLGSHQGVLFTAAFSNSDEDGNSITAGDLGLSDLEILLSENLYSDSGDVIYSLGLNRTANKIVVHNNSAENGLTATVRGLAIGK